ncbi:uncharacterized protein LOC125721731 [Brienomyrus brachyistius]|uniref:uncharacterized protein LOC125721731 n=1 Tax=Brienomyrus brachyistius TaxID=42636 RepID=UPI0020B1CCCE|nr:uncharacterized protein LOC125721731 [Brienomyrus brachyistius]
MTHSPSQSKFLPDRQIRGRQIEAGMDSWILHALLVAGLVIYGSNAGVTSGYNGTDNVTKNSGDDGDNEFNGKTQSLAITSVTNNVTNMTTITSVTNLTAVHNTSLKVTPPKHSHTPNLSPQGKLQTGWLLLALGIVLLFCTALLVSTITLACQVRNLRDQLSSVWPAHPARVNADVIRVGKVTEVMETEMEKMMEEAENTVEKTLRVEADAQETEAATVVPTAPPADPSSDCVLNV